MNTAERTKIDEKANLLKLESYRKAIVDLKWQALKIEIMIAFNRYVAATNEQATVVHLTKDAERTLDAQFSWVFKDRDWEEELGDKYINLHTAIDAGIGAWRVSGSTLFGRTIAWDAKHIMVGDGDAITAQISA